MSINYIIVHFQSGEHYENEKRKKWPELDSKIQGKRSTKYPIIVRHAELTDKQALL